MGTTLFIFAHQDDEYGIASRIEYELTLGNQVLCMYLTNGRPTAIPPLRDAESLRALQSLGVQRQNIIFLGTGLDIDGLQLHLNLDTVFTAMTDWLSTHHVQPTRMYVTAWEGGHPDHDAAYAIACAAARRYEVLEAWQYSMYNGFRRPGPFFRVLSPIQTSVMYSARRLSMWQRIRFACFCRFYPSQFRTWLGLFPGAFVRMLVGKGERIAPIDSSAISVRPHHGALYYERRFGVAFEEVSERCASLLGR